MRRRLIIPRALDALGYLFKPGLDTGAGRRRWSRGPPIIGLAVAGLPHSHRVRLGQECLETGSHGS